MSRLSQLIEFRAKLVRAKKFIDEHCRADGPLCSVALTSEACCIQMPDGSIVAPYSSTFYEWTRSVKEQVIYLMYDNSIAHVDALIEREKGRVMSQFIAVLLVFVFASVVLKVYGGPLLWFIWFVLMFLLGIAAFAAYEETE